MSEVKGFFEKLEGIFAKEDFTKAQVVEAIKEFIPNFEHEEKGKNLGSEDVMKTFLKGIWQFCSYIFWPQWGKQAI